MKEDVQHGRAPGGDKLHGLMMPGHVISGALGGEVGHWGRFGQ